MQGQAHHFSGQAFQTRDHSFDTENQRLALEINLIHALQTCKAYFKNGGLYLIYAEGTGPKYEEK